MEFLSERKKKLENYLREILLREDIEKTGLIAEFMKGENIAKNEQVQTKLFYNRLQAQMKIRTSF